MKQSVIRITLTAFLSFAVIFCAQSKPKYIFFLIGDGMGLNHVNLTEMYLAAQDSTIGCKALCMRSLPVSNFATSYCANTLVTDSAAAGTALATGNKTNKKMIGMGPDGKEFISIAEKARNSGMRVGIISTDNLNQSTPAAFSAHESHRERLDQITMDMSASGFELLCGAIPTASKKDGIPSFNPVKQFEESGYTVVDNVQDMKKGNISKALLIPQCNYFVNVIDRTAANYTGPTLPEALQGGIDFLMGKGCPKGFFIMLEGAHIDHLAHGNDGASLVKEVIEFDNTVKVAYEFYKKHPKETLIIVTADHDTGGDCLISNSPESLYLLNCQQSSLSRINNDFRSLLKNSTDGTLSWDVVQAFLKEKFGFWNKINISAKDEALLKDIHGATVAQGKLKSIGDEYGHIRYSSLIHAAGKIINSSSGIKWGTSSHSSAYVPVFAIGYECDRFNGRLDNTDIPKRICEIFNLGK